jgi:hypothetical protein
MESVAARIMALAEGSAETNVASFGKIEEKGLLRH